MAIVVNGTVNAIPAEKIPAGYTLPIVTLIPDFHYRYDVVIPLVFSTTATTSNPVTTMTALVSATNTAVASLLALDFLATANVTAYAVINSIDTNLNNNSTTYLTNVTPSYLVSTTIFVKSI